MTSATDLLPDDVWRALDPDAGRLSRRQRLHLWLAGVLALAVVAALTVVWQSGVVVPHIVRGASDDSWSADTATHRVTRTIEIRNDGWGTAHVLSVGRSGPGIALRSVDTALPTDLPPSTGVVVTLTYDVTDCAAVPQGNWPIPVRVQRPWGAWTSWVGPEAGIPPTTKTPGGLFRPTEYEVPWQRVLSLTACSPSPVDASTPAG